MNKLTEILGAALIIVISILGYFQSRVTTLKRDVVEITSVARLQQKQIQLIEIQRQNIAAIDIKYTKELADAKSENERLRADIANGTKRLQLNANCTKPVPKIASTASVDDVTSPELTDSARRDYLSLRERIGIATSQIAGLQEYVRQQCLN
ncbi:lysis protein [Yersinia pseudotuberculosis]|uniref:lysis protein n=1 Tax=Yersinia pseudotuberculosis TaxID=633 RepID=UPI0005DE7C2C|nr:lysis protein [Yersinia pseudotuberculosis]PSH14882.1 lysis protein [Yersinia pseudotuberculosis]PSH25324.1 lysis protein [Yersinia pseudotuberculosis]PSH31902.1 lysis protein [Yersinia pseudotuberculosis]PSH31977.1 endopeptidase [Yersinia pseudotuberculosis]PST80259.1 lysis protein [Yersinia pseudotuberculosis]